MVSASVVVERSRGNRTLPITSGLVSGWLQRWQCPDFPVMSEIAVAAPRLSVHPSTYRYRLARAQEIFGFALVKADEHLRLWPQLRFSDRLGFGTRTPPPARP